MGRKKKTNNEFIKEAIAVHGDNYSYNETQYLGANIKTLFFCKRHGHFEQTPNVHLRGHGCPKCGDDIQKRKNSSNLDYFILKANKIHNNRYSYNKTKYVRNRDKIIITCPEHGDFEQIARYHLDGNGCKNCQYDEFRLDRENFINKSKKIHEDKYDYSLVVYKNQTTEVSIICDKHGIFNQRPHNHINNHGCPICKLSKGEKKIRKFLLLNNIKFESQKKFNGCVNKRFLPFDFYIKEKNLLIEYDGIQHYEASIFFGGEKTFNYLKLNDKIKNNYAKINNIDLIRIPYYEYNNIERILNNNI